MYPFCNLPVVSFNANAIRTIQPWWEPEGNPSFQVCGVALAAAPTVPAHHSSSVPDIFGFLFITLANG